jgi:hypothetical protein
MAKTQDERLEKFWSISRQYWGTVKQESMDVGFLIFSTIIMNPLDRLKTLKQAKVILQSQEVDVHSTALGNAKGSQL